MIENVKLLNFISHAETDLKFRPGVTVFVGRNGAGKSSVIDGITYALYGKHTRNENQNLIRRGATAGYASVLFSVGSRQYLAERKLNKRGKLEGSVLKEIVNGEQKQLGGGERKQLGESLSDEVSKVIGLDYQRMQVAAIIQQGELDAIIDLTPGKLKDLINDLIGIDSLGTAYESMKDIIGSFRDGIRVRYGYDDLNIETIKNAIAEQEEIQQSSERQLGILLGELEYIRAEERELAQEQDKLEPLKAKAGLLASKVSTLVDYVVQESGRMKERLAEIEEVTDKASAYLKTVSEAESIAKEDQETRKLQNENETEIDRLAKEISELEAQEGRPAELLNLAARAQRLLDTKKREAKIREQSVELPTRLRSLDSQVNDLKEQRGKLVGYKETAQRLEFKDNVCPLCGSKVERINELFDRNQVEKHIAEHDQAIQGLQREKEELEPQVEKATRQLAELEEASSFLSENKITTDQDVTRLEDEGIKLSSRLEALPMLRDTHSRALEKKEILKAKAEEIQAKVREVSIANSYLSEHKVTSSQDVEVLAKDGEAIRRGLEGVPEDIDEMKITAEVDRLRLLAIDDYSRKQLAEIGNIHEDAARFNAERYKECVRELEELRSVTLVKKVGEVESCKTKRDAAQEQLINLRQTLGILQNVSEYVSFLDRIREKVYHRDGPVSSSLRSWALKEIGVKATEYARLFGIGVSSISFTEKARDVSIECYGPRGKVQVESMSGGEKVAIALALRFAMAYVMGGYKLDFVILDEPTVHLDEDRKASLVEIISRLGRMDSPLRQMIVITHDEEIFENAEIDAVFRFEASSEGTRVKLEEA